MKRQVPPYQKAIDLLSRRSHFHRELETKLARRGYDEADVAETLARLEREGLVDDLRVAEEFVRSKLERAPQGWRRLMSDLTRKGVDGDVARQAVERVLPDDDLELARQAARRHHGRNPASLARHLERRGFSRRAIVSVLREAGADGAAEDLEAGESGL